MLAALGTILTLFAAVYAQSTTTSGSSNSSTAATGQCLAYPGGVCSGYVNYTVYMPEGVSFAQVEQQLSVLTNLSAQLSDIDYACVESYYRFACPFYYSRCVSESANETKILTACESTCESVNATCGLILKLNDQSALIPDCATAVSPLTHLAPQPEDSCNLVPPKDAARAAQGLNLSAVPDNFVMSECPSPFVIDPLAAKNSTLDTRFCRLGCCIPCPSQNFFYPEGYLEKGFFATDIIRSVSAACVLIIVVSYLVLPDKRRHPTVLVLFLGISVFLFSMVAFFSVGNTKALQCASDGIRAADQDNNKLCAAQGAILVFASFASVVWCSILILNLHLHTVWNSTFLVNKYILMNIIGWGVPSAMMGVALGLHAVKFEFANLCLVNIDYIFDIFFYPLAAFVCPAFLIHLLTFFYIGKIAIREGVQSEMSQSLSRTSATDEVTTRARRHKHVINAFKIQWRALLLSLILVVAVLFYWLFYFTQVRTMSTLVYDESKILDWIGCMLNANGQQNDCVHVLSSSLPPFPLMIVAETLVSTIGTAVFITFAKRSLLREWNDLIYDIRVSLGMRSHVEKNGEQFFAL